MLTLADWLRCLQVPAGVLEAANCKRAYGPIARLRLVQNHLGATLAQLGTPWSGNRTNVA